MIAETCYHYTELARDDTQPFQCVPQMFMGEHSYSWLTLGEINKYKHWDRIEYVQQEFKDLFFRCPNLKNWRLIFGFDS